MTDHTDRDPTAFESAGKRLTDIEVAAFLANFRDRPQEQQEVSPVWQELSGFPQWSGAQFRGDSAPTLDAPPDPRLPARERAAEVEKQREANPVPDPHEPRPSPTPNVMTTGDVGQGANPWADVRPPADDGSGCFVGVNTDVKPPFPGNWRRVERGWYRDAD